MSRNNVSNDVIDYYYEMDGKSTDYYHIYYEGDIEKVNSIWSREPHFVPLITLYTSCFLCGVVGNGIVLFAIIGSKKTRNVTFSFMYSLAVADLLFLLVCIPIDTLGMVLGNWAGGVVFCKLSGFAEMLSAVSSILNLSTISIERGEGSGEEVPFRESFSKIGELRSLCPDVQMVALTATAGPTQRRKIMKSLCFKKDTAIINESVDRRNIKISAMTITNNEPVTTTFNWLLHELSKFRINLPRHVIFCESISDVSKIYSSFVKKLGKELHKFFNMFHSKTNEVVKNKIRNDMAHDGEIRILVCTNAAGMGVNFWGVHNVIHYGLPRQMDTFVQQMGRAGRDGTYSNELIIFKAHKGHLRKVEPDLVKLAKDTESCRHQVLCDSYLNDRNRIVPLHNCCDFCEKRCDCGDGVCPNQHNVFQYSLETAGYENEMERPVSEMERKHLNQRLLSLRYSLSEQAISSYVESDINSLSESVISDIVEKCNLVFTVGDLMKMFPIWSYSIAQQIFSIISEVFGDTEMYAFSNSDSSESDS